jgi:hypothetical protein
MKKRLLFLGCSLLIAGCGSETSSPSGDGRVQYKTASDEVNRAAETAVRDFLSSQEPHRISDAWLSDFVTCGPHLWAKIKDNPAFAGLTFGGVFMHAATISPSGDLLRMRTLSEATNFKGADDVGRFWTVVRETMSVSGEWSVRKPDTSELKILASQVPFVLEEPIFVAAGRKCHLIIVMTAEDGRYKPLWVENLSGVNQ